MPPWPADRNYSHFIGEKYLSPQEIERIEQWVRSGALEGEGVAPDLPTLSKYSRIGNPDTTIWFDSILIPGTNTDRFMVVSLPIELPADRYVKAMEFVPNENNLVHHMNGHLLVYEEDARKALYSGSRWVNVELDTAEYNRGFNRLELYNDDGTEPFRIHSAVNYLPGVEATVYPDGIGGFLMKKKSILVANDMHYGPIPQPKWDRSHVNIFFTDKAPDRVVQETMMGTNGISKIIPPLVVPPNEITEHISFIEVDQDISILTINPHMHLLGKSFKAYAIDPQQDTIRLISIPNWDFRWQYFYTYERMLKIPAGSVIYVEAVFDNTLNNPNNPFNPPITIAERLDRGGEGMRTTDEMLQFIISWLPYQEGDENISLEPVR